MSLVSPVAGRQHIYTANGAKATVVKTCIITFFMDTGWTSHPSRPYRFVGKWVVSSGYLAAHHIAGWYQRAWLAKWLCRWGDQVFERECLFWSHLSMKKKYGTHTSAARSAALTGENSFPSPNTVMTISGEELHHVDCGIDWWITKRLASNTNQIYLTELSSFEGEDISHGGSNNIRFANTGVISVTAYSLKINAKRNRTCLQRWGGSWHVLIKVI